jgi:BMFP domain-containing protein YqiC
VKRSWLRKQRPVTYCRSLYKSRAENAELQLKVKELEARLAELENIEEVESTEEAEKAAA